jgi:hypothetical protein
MIGACRIGLENHNTGSRRRSRQNTAGATVARLMAGAGFAVVWPERLAVALIGGLLFARALWRLRSSSA